MMKRIYVKPETDIHAMAVENCLLAGSGEEGRYTDPENPGSETPGGKVSTDLGDLEGGTQAKGGGFWDEWD